MTASYDSLGTRGESRYEEKKSVFLGFANPVTTEEYGLSKAARPFNSRLDKTKLSENGFEPMPHWQDALARYLREIED